MESTPLLRSCKPCHRVVSVVLSLSKGFLNAYFSYFFLYIRLVNGLIVVPSPISCALCDSTRSFSRQLKDRD
jgi:hypothetical protein